MNEKIVLDVIKRLDKPFKKPNWGKAWDGVCQGSVPEHKIHNQPYRMNGYYVEPRHEYEEYDKWVVILEDIFTKFIKKPSSIIEFGCGSGHNLDTLRNLFNCTVIGVDKYHKDTPYFDMEKPVLKPSLEADYYLTISSVEQLGNNFEPFIKWCMKQRPERVIHIEPIYEFYDENNLMDYLAIKYHRIRGYPIGFFPYLCALDTEKKIRIIESKRLHFGSLFHEASVIVWEPLMK